MSGELYRELRAALLGDLLDPFLQLLDVVAHEAAVRLQLGLAGSSGADPTARSRKVRPHSSQAGQLVLELRQLDLETALVRLRVLREDVQDEPRAVDHLGLDRFLQGPLLRRRKLIVRDQNRVSGLRPGGHQLVDLALADVVVGIDMAAVLPFSADHLCAGCVRQAGELTDRLLGRPARVVAGVHGHEESPLHGRGEIDHVFAHIGAG